MIYSLSRKNIWRNKVRSLIVMGSVTVGLICGIFFIAFMNGMTVQRINSAIKSEVSHIQIHNPAFLDDNEVQYTIPNIDELTNLLDTTSTIMAYAPRITITGMIGSARSSEGVNIVGINPDKERMVTDIHTKITDSVPNYFGKKRPIMISKRLADKMRVKLNSKIVLTFQSTTGELTGAPFKVTALYQTSNKVFDEMMVFVPQQKIAAIAGLKSNQAHEIAILLKSNLQTADTKENITEAFPNITARTWKKIMPELGMMVDMMDSMLYVFMIIILVALAFGIINTMMMAVLERQREIGMLMAIGMNKKRVFTMIMLETIYISMTGAIVGMLISHLILSTLANTGIDMSLYAEGLEAYGYDKIIYPAIDLIHYINISVLVVITAIVSSVWPARKALKLKPAVSMRIE